VTPSGWLVHVVPAGQSLCPMRHHLAQVPFAQPWPGAHARSFPGTHVPGPIPAPAPPMQSAMSGNTTAHVVPGPQRAAGSCSSQPAVHAFQPGTGVPMYTCTQLEPARGQSATVLQKGLHEYPTQLVPVLHSVATLQSWFSSFGPAGPQEVKPVGP
jgi:hypothetical protein